MWVDRSGLSESLDEAVSNDPKLAFLGLKLFGDTISDASLLVFLSCELSAFELRCREVILLSPSVFTVYDDDTPILNNTC